MVGMGSGAAALWKGEEAMANASDPNVAVIAEFRANQGVVAAPYENPPPMLLVHTIGARSGREHVVPMRCLPDGETLYIFASAHGSRRHPDWYHHIVAHPEITIEKGAETIPVRATEVVGAEREAIFARQPPASRSSRSTRARSAGPSR
jgi:deazaflavin-dependent oxidoreductase (nitroreductase family)